MLKTVLTNLNKFKYFVRILLINQEITASTTEREKIFKKKTIPLHAKTL